MLKSKELNKLQLRNYKSPIVFDLYDTLLDESSIYKKFFLQIAKKYRIEMTAEEFVGKIFQNQHKFVFSNAQKSLKEISRLSYIMLIKQADPKDVELLFDLFSELSFFPGVIDLLLKLEKNHDLFILTNIDNDLLEKVDLPAKCPVRFKKIFTAENNGIYKPNPKAYQIVADFIGLPPKKIVYVSSNGWDIEKSREFGFNVKMLNELGK